MKFFCNSSFRQNIFDLNQDFDSCLKIIDWKRGKPYIWRIKLGCMSDIQLLKILLGLFVRKSFSSYMEIIEMIKKLVNK